MKSPFVAASFWSVGTAGPEGWEALSSLEPHPTIAITAKRISKNLICIVFLALSKGVAVGPEVARIVGLASGEGTSPIAPL